MGGLNLLTNAYTSNNASIIAMLKPWEESARAQEEQLRAILVAAQKKFAAYPEAVSLVFPPPADQRPRQRVRIRLRAAG